MWNACDKVEQSGLVKVLPGLPGGSHCQVLDQRKRHDMQLVGCIVVCRGGVGWSGMRGGHQFQSLSQICNLWPRNFLNWKLLLSDDENTTAASSEQQAAISLEFSAAQRAAWLELKAGAVCHEPCAMCVAGGRGDCDWKWLPSAVDRKKCVKFSTKIKYISDSKSNVLLLLLLKLNLPYDDVASRLVHPLFGKFQLPWPKCSRNHLAISLRFRCNFPRAGSGVAHVLLLLLLMLQWKCSKQTRNLWHTRSRKAFPSIENVPPALPPARHEA